ncbi:RICIN domain-containing protein [Sphaerisporangium sp. NPDC049002]|uniref:RICIN domain-containing protein n=1 Tax=unclassified Sphaerisporangium TaxID=2630420 RepID=UPI0033E51633
MRTRKLFAVAAASLVALATVFISQAPANASITTYISVLPQSGTKMVLDTKMDSSTANGMANGAPAQLWQLRTASPGVEVGNQRWIITVKYIDADNHVVYELKNQLSGKCLDMAIDGAIGNNTRVQQWDCSGASNQRWTAVPAPADLGSSWVQLVNLRSGLCLDISGASYTNGRPLVVYQCHGSWNQRWNIYY